MSFLDSKLYCVEKRATFATPLLNLNQVENRFMFGRELHGLRKRRDESLSRN
ncbi:hypothetical protein Poly41_59680 [Novipirellula artificiosorum]|uniref:Uncharacterized protein n=2 Tax=Novipirellula artificiosorum TaxID=2528016 RepID=A0A5C6D3E5_9BACT|nr:hypothetical protein Poly41_59680 [Novipirellula artificiosorum]